MNWKRNIRMLMFAAGSLGAVLLLLNQSSGVQRFVRYAEESSQGTAKPVVAWSNPLKLAWLQQEDDPKEQTLAWLQSEAAKRNIPPINAKIDQVWKAIPGYNGLEVDIERSLAAAEAQGYKAPLPIIYREVPPAVGLDQLGAQPIYKGNPNKPMVAFMINVAWGDEFLPGILKTLEKEGVKATFFFDGSWLKKNVATAKQILEKGHELSNHAYSHKNMSQLSREQNRLEISKTETLLKEQVGVTNRLFAPPSGDFNTTTVEVAHELKLRTILWTLDTVDWRNPGADWILRRISARIEPGSLILMHPTQSSSEALEGMIRIVKSKGLTFGTVSQVISPDRVPEVESKGQ